MKIDAMVPDVKDFVTEYNRFINALAVRIRAEGDMEMFFRISQWWKIFDNRKPYPDDILLDFMLTNEGHLILECTDPGFVNEFERFWQECQARWGIADQDDALSDREKEIANLYAAGLTKKAIAEKLKLSANTVKTHIENIVEKLGIKGKKQYARLLSEKGYGKVR